MISYREIYMLARAVEQAEEWRGALVGNPNPGPLQEYDAFIAQCKATLRKLRKAKRINAIMNKQQTHPTSEVVQ